MTDRHAREKNEGKCERRLFPFLTGVCPLGDREYCPFRSLFQNFSSCLYSIPLNSPHPYWWCQFKLAIFSTFYIYYCENYHICCVYSLLIFVLECWCYMAFDFLYWIPTSNRKFCVFYQFVCNICKIDDGKYANKMCPIFTIVYKTAHPDCRHSNALCIRRAPGTI